MNIVKTVLNIVNISLLLGLVSCSSHRGALAPVREYGQFSSVDSPHNIALLLPLQGPHKNAALAVRDGVLAGYFQAQSNHNGVVKRSIKIYDTGNGNNPSQVKQAYQTALTDESQIIIGPLTKIEVETLASLKSSIPILALNTLNTTLGPASNITQFGLNPIDEAQSIAKQAHSQGLNTALAIVPKGEWGQRMLQAFKSEFEGLGGRLIDTQIINSTPDLTTSLQTFLQASPVKPLKSSEAPHARTDSQFIFMAVSPELGRQIKPILNYYYGFNFPIYASSHIYQGNPNTHLDLDLDGVQFCDIPWIFAANTQGSHFQASVSLVPRLFALGLDAFALIEQRYPFSRLQDSHLQGETGTLSIDPAARIHRDLAWGHFQNGRAVGFASLPAH